VVVLLNSKLQSEIKFGARVEVKSLHGHLERTRLVGGQQNNKSAVSNVKSVPLVSA
jgi:hypothetical protein